ncbi:MAG: hypothetical protein F6K31_26390 [Symploca sp. SIO2G7]|nr:hypothetical protein [Symploca sp. SIO2G7]
MTYFLRAPQLAAHRPLRRKETFSNPLPFFLSSFLLCCLLPDELLPVAR